MRSPPRRQQQARGQGLTETIIAVALVGIASIGVITVYGGNLRQLFDMGADATAGNADTMGIRYRGAYVCQKTSRNMTTFAQANMDSEFSGCSGQGAGGPPSAVPAGLGSSGGGAPSNAGGTPRLPGY